jgi:hypothetical protein
MQGGGGPIYPRNRRMDRTARVAARVCREWDSSRMAAERQGGQALTRRRSTVATGAVKGTRGVGILSVRRHRDGELDREGAAVATRRARCLRAPR